VIGFHGVVVVVVVVVVVIVVVVVVVLDTLRSCIFVIVDLTVIHHHDVGRVVWVLLSPRPKTKKGRGKGIMATGVCSKQVYQIRKKEEQCVRMTAAPSPTPPVR